MFNFVSSGCNHEFHAKQDASKKGHNQIFRQECNSEKSQSTNCSDTHKECDHESKKVFAVGHRT